jgi:hypothetical protein
MDARTHKCTKLKNIGAPTVLMPYAFAPFKDPMEHLNHIIVLTFNILLITFSNILII